IRLKKLFEVETLDAFGDFSNVEISAAGVLIDYIELTQKGQMPILRPLRQIGISAVMEIDAATRRNLELTRPLFTEHQDKGACLLSVIDHTVTGSGARLLMQRLSSPLTEPLSINERLDMVGFFVEHEAVRSEIRERLKLCPDIERSLTRLSFGRGGARDLAAVMDSLKQIPSLRIAVSCSSDGEIFSSTPESLLSCVKELGHHETLVDRLEKALDAELPVLIRDGGFIAPNYHAGLDELRKLRDESKRLINILQHRYVNETGVSSLKIRFNNMLGYFIEVPSRHGNKLMSEGSAFIHRQTMASNVRFTTVELSELENRIRGAAEKALALELQIFSDLVKEVLSRSEEIATAARSLAVLDVSSSLAELAVKKGYCRPVIDKSLAFEIKDGRHPVVEAALEADLESSFVSNDCILGKNGNDTDKRLWLVTGPNMAGKSTFLRQNALIAILSQMGSYVPAGKAHIGAVDRLFSRVGAADDLARGRSTFMVEMVETAVILNQATERSLVILDEIGRGTATFDGLSIAWAVVEHLHEINGCRTLFATHYHELTTLASRLENLSLHCMRVKEWHGDVVFLHEIGSGSADRSYGIHVAKLAGLPKNVVIRAEKVLESLETGEQSSAITKLADDLPLFIAAKEQIIITESQSSELKEALKEINPDEMTPKQAMEALYELKALEATL
ncbi:MAG: DNA mismatch repair protein MutS, partial [Alphaproteobacteria bacterium]|nr:DNA mismatch repair protein MutS [Alphaproteobacteria bacterium]